MLRKPSDFIWGGLFLSFGGGIGRVSAAVQFFVFYFPCLFYLALVTQLFSGFVALMSGSFKLTTWNIQGLGHVIKRKKILTFLKKKKNLI